MSEQEAAPSDPYEVVLARGARKALSEQLTLPVAVAVYELLSGDLRRQPRRVGKPLHAPFEGHWVARRGTYRIRYRIDDEKRMIVVLAVVGRADAYLPGCT